MRAVITISFNGDVKRENIIPDLKLDQFLPADITRLCSSDETFDYFLKSDEFVNSKIAVPADTKDRHVKLDLIHRVYGEKLFDTFSIKDPLRVREKDNIFFYGTVDRGEFIISQINQTSIRLRVHNVRLDELQKSVLKIIKTILKSSSNNYKWEVEDGVVRIHDNGQEYPLIDGRLIANPLMEVWRSDKRNVLLTIIFGTITTICYSAPFINSSNTTIASWLSRISTPATTTLIVGFVGLLQTYLEVLGNKLIDWKASERG